MLRVVRPQSRYWSVHTHSKYSYGDALPDVADIVARAYDLGQPAVGLTDHGNIAGSVELYQECTKRGIKPFPGSELYLVRDRRDKKSKRYHMGVLAHTTMGYKNLVRISTMTHRHFHHKPLIDLADMAELSEHGYTEGLALTTGCYFGLVTQTLINEGHQATRRLIASLASWWPSLYVEMQAHAIEHEDAWSDDSIADGLHEVATQLGLPVVVTQDSHYVERDDRGDHDALKQLVAYGSDLDDAVFPGDGFHLADESWMAAHHSPTRLQAGLDGLRNLLDSHDLSISALDTYHYRIPEISLSPDTELTQLCYAELDQRGLGPRYKDRLAEELDVIAAAGMASYMLLTKQVCDHMRAEGIYYQTRGSAAGSLVCWLCQITQLDPLKWGLRFERFLSKDRTKPPDIDLDIEHYRRQDLIAWLETKYAVHQIGTWSELSMSGDEDGKGSLRVKYFSKMRQAGKPFDNWDEVPEADKKQLYALSERKPYGGVGTHASGLVVTNTKAQFDDIVPLMYIASSKTMVTQYAMDQIEDLGLVKLDVLGSKTLSVLGKTLELLERNKSQGLEWIPTSDTKTLSMIKAGDTDGVFQLEGWSARKGCQRLKPTTVKDVIAAMALFRPATQDSGATQSYINRKHRREGSPRLHPIITESTKDTHQVVLYQDQVIVILRKMGMEPDELTDFLKAVKASNKGVTKAAETIAKYTDWVHRVGTNLGMKQADLDFLDRAFAGFSEYSFNLAHSTIYGLTAYRCAYLAMHHRLEFHTALLSVAAGNKDKEPVYLRATKNRGIKILKPCVNRSAVDYTIDRQRNAIRRGLLSVKGVGEAAAEELMAHQPFKDLDELIAQCSPKKVSGAKAYKAGGSIDDANGTIRTLYEAGVLDEIV